LKLPNQEQPLKEVTVSTITGAITGAVVGLIPG